MRALVRVDERKAGERLRLSHQVRIPGCIHCDCLACFRAGAADIAAPGENRIDNQSLGAIITSDCKRDTIAAQDITSFYRYSSASCLLVQNRLAMPDFAA